MPSWARILLLDAIYLQGFRKLHFEDKYSKKYMCQITYMVLFEINEILLMRDLKKFLFDFIYFKEWYRITHWKNSKKRLNILRYLLENRILMRMALSLSWEALDRTQHVKLKVSKVINSRELQLSSSTAKNLLLYFMYT